MADRASLPPPSPPQPRFQADVACPIALPLTRSPAYDHSAGCVGCSGKLRTLRRSCCHRLHYRQGQWLQKCRISRALTTCSSCPAQAKARNPASSMLLVLLATLVSLSPAQAQPEIEGPCQLTDGGVCATSPDFPRPYPANQPCTLSSIPSSALETIHFDVEPDLSPTHDNDGEDGGDCDFDYLKVNGKRYCGRAGPEGVVVDGIIKWSSDSDTEGSGWKARSPLLLPHRLPRLTARAPFAAQICWATRPPQAPLAPPLPPLPPLSPLPPLRPSPSVSPLPMLQRRASSIKQLRARFKAAVDNGAKMKIQLEPQVYFLGQRGEISCNGTASIEVLGHGVSLASTL